MKYLKIQLKYLFPALALSAGVLESDAQSKKQPEYHIYAGSTHAHTAYTSSHGSNLKHLPGFTKFLFIDSNSVGHAINSEQVKDADKLQGPPSAHFALAKSLGYDWYITTDHSQEPSFYPTSPNAPDWIASHNQAKAATDKNFVAISGYEHSENNGPGATGHLNVINSRSYLNALAPGTDIKSLYKWLDTVSAYGEGPVVATFNHPSAKGYDNWAYREPKVTEIITMLEVLNSNKSVHYDGFVNALDAGWKVSPVAGNDNHGLDGIKNSHSRTFVLATAKTQAAILDAMKNRRTYASMDQNIQCRYTVNGQIMGSTLKSPGTFKFDIQISDPDTSDPKDKITRIDIVKDNGTVVETYNVPTPAHSVKWSPTITDATNKYFFVRVWSNAGSDAGKADAMKPVAWLAPVWTGR